MNISLRLKTVAAQVEPCGILADIGTDHAFIPIYLCINNIISKAIACDINIGPLEKAKGNIYANMLEERIEVRLGGGFEPISPFEADSAVMAGMGGMLIIDILSESLETVNSLKQMVIQPQHDISAVRRFLHEIGWKIINEEMVVDAGKYYTVINTKKGTDMRYSEMDYIFGKLLIENKNTVLRDYIVGRMEKKRDIIDSLKEADAIKSIQRLEQLKREYVIEQEVYECL